MNTRKTNQPNGTEPQSCNIFVPWQIAQARRKTETAKDLDGIDLGNVVAGSRRRRGVENENVCPPKKKQNVQGQGEVPESECSEDESSSEEDSEEEFQLSG